MKFNPFQKIESNLGVALHTNRKKGEGRRQANCL